jgi:hypothetical protein
MLRKTLLPILLTFALVACNLALASPGDGPAGLPTTDPQVQIDLAVSQTFDVQTQIARSVQLTMDAMVTNTPERPSETPSPIFTFTPTVPMVTVSIETNCRTGPGTAYDNLGVLPVGQPAEVIGRNASGDTWIIRLPSNPAIICWLWGYYATVSGNTSGLIVYTPPSTPTPQPSFTLSYLQTVTCSGKYAFRFQVVNNGGIPWESYKVDVTDSTTATTKTFSDAYFTDYTGCGPFVSQVSDLMPGEMAVAGNWNTGLFDYNPAGHNISATFTLCSQNGMGAPCTSKTISFVP